MILNLILGSVIVISLGLVVLIVIKKIPRMKVLDVATVPQAKIALVRERILLEKMKRQTEKSRELLKKSTMPLKRFFQWLAGKIWRQYIAWEKKYQKEIQSAGPDQTLTNKLNTLLSEAVELLAAERLNEAEKIYIEVIGLDAKNIPTYEGLSDIYLQRKEYSEALETQEFILKLLMKKDKPLMQEMAGRKVKTFANAKEVAEGYFALGKTCLLMNNMERAAENFSRALNLEPNSPKYLDQMIQASVQLKQRDLAAAMWQRLAEVNPENQKLKEYQDKISQL